jgi:hypothetical protein
MLDDLLMEASIFPASGSDHWPIQLWIDTVGSSQSNPFRFEKFLLSHPDF